MGLTNGNDGKPMPAQLGIGGAFIPKGAKNVDVAKDFMKYLIQPKIVNDYLKNGLGRWLPPYPSVVKNDSWWFDDPHRKPYTTEALLDPTVAGWPVFNPGWAEVNAQQVWGAAEADVIRNGSDPKEATEAAFKKIEAILAKYPIVQS
jgi:multiple sugar transport system substrate-binding protein